MYVNTYANSFLSLCMKKFEGYSFLLTFLLLKVFATYTAVTINFTLSNQY